MKTFSFKLIFLSLLTVYMLFDGIAAYSDPHVTILVNKGSFSSVEEASASEEKVNWWNDDLSDDRACTECFAARELAHFLSACRIYSEEEITFSSPDTLPSYVDTANRLLNSFPPAILGGYWVYVAVVVSFIFVLVVLFVLVV